MSQSARVLGVDIGGTTVKVGAATPQGELLSRVRSRTQRANGQAILEGILETIGRAIREAGLMPTDIAAVGIGAPGSVDRKGGLWAGSTTIRLGVRVSLTDMVRERFAIPAFIDNDGNVAALGEMRFGAGADVLDMIYITLGSGVGGAIIIDGHIHYGRGRIAGEIGHMIIQKDGPLCGCGAHGCLEALASATAMIRKAQAALQAGEPTLLRGLVEGGPARLNGEIIARAARWGDQVALRIWREAGKALGVAIYSLAMLLGPEVFIIGGALAQAGQLLINPMYERLEEESRGRFDPRRVRMAALGAEAGLMGGVALALQMADS